MNGLEKWKNREELATGLKVMAVRSDNAAEIREKLDEWSKQGVREEPTVAYEGSHQNGVAERNIQEVEAGVRSSLKDAGLPLEFWDWAAEHSTHLWNIMPHGPLVDSVRLTPKGAYSGNAPDVDYVKVFGCVCYSYVSPKSWPRGTTSKKFLDRGREGVFVGHSEETAQQYWVYAPDLGRAELAKTVDFDENRQGGDLDLRIRGTGGDLSQGSPSQEFTSSAPQTRNPVGRPPREETIPIVTELPKTLNNFSIEIPAKPEPPISLDQQDQDEHSQEEEETPQAQDKEDPFIKPGSVKENSQSSPNPSVETGSVKENDQSRPSGRETRSAKRNRDARSTEQESRPERSNLSPPASTVEDKEPGAPEGGSGREEVPEPVGANESSAPGGATTGNGKRKDHDATEDDRANKRVRAFTAALVERRILELEIESEETAFLAAGGRIEITIPKTYKEAISDLEHSEEWTEAIREEIASLMANGTWKEEKAPQGTNLVSTKWVFTIKTNPDGSLERYKARLVARGFSQIYGEDYTETFAPTVRVDTLRVFFAMVAAEDLECWQYDVKNAFTEATLKEQIYLSQPDGVPVRKGYALKVLRSLYGLKQAARDWNTLCKDYLLELEFVQSLADPCLFTHAKRGIKLLVYVDDMAAAAKNKSELDWFFASMKKRFHTKDLGEIKKILGIRVTRNRATRELFLDQQEYLEKVLQRLGLPMESSSTGRPRLTPIAGKYDKLEGTEPNEERTDRTEYQRKVGSVMYAAVYTRPDIAFHIRRLSQHLQDPTERHSSGMKDLGRYLRTTIQQKIRYGPPLESESRYSPNYAKRTGRPDRRSLLILYSDADWANMKGRKSISGDVAMLYGGPVGYGSKKQRSVSTSSTESEYIGMANCCKKGQWLAQVLRDIGFPEYIGRNPKCVDMRADNQGAMALVMNPELHERSKHIDVSYHHIRDLEAKKRMSITYIPTGHMVADGFTKPLEKTLFGRFKSMMGLVDKGIAALG